MATIMTGVNNVNRAKGRDHLGIDCSFRRTWRRDNIPKKTPERTMKNMSGILSDNSTSGVLVSGRVYPQESIKRQEKKMCHKVNERPSGGIGRLRWNPK
jgi:hypothetical protein